MSNNGGTERGSGDSSVESGSLSLDATLELLSEYDRRTVLDYLRDADDGTATVDELAEHVAAHRAERAGERPGHDRVATTLHHAHLPKLDDAGVADYDVRNGTVQYGGNDRLEEWHDRIQFPQDD